MNGNIWVAVIGAIATLGAALINKKNLDTMKSEEKEMKMSFLTTRVFTWVIAPLAGGLIALSVVHGVRVIAASSVPLQAPF